MNQTAHISLQLSNNVKEQTSKTQKQTVAQILQRHRLHPTMNAPVYPERPNRLSGPSSPVVPASPRWLSVPSGVSQQRLSAAGEGGSKHNLRCPQPLFCKTVIFSPKINKTTCFHRDKLLQDLSDTPDPARNPNLLAHKSDTERGIAKRCEEIPLRSDPSWDRELQSKQQKETDSAQIQQRFDLKPFREQHKVQCCQECCRVGESVELAPSRPEFANRGRV